ncbi:SdiA-regulated domain-containing protein [Pedobacter sp. Du54]|uniref:SdiA-regulated domain-containing protein n=1 Tax=Pedobacter anseongensis TaxID=3133439 RepID=UPI0030AC13DA
MLKNYNKQILGIAALSLIVSFIAISCVGKKEKAVIGPPGYNLNNPQKYSMPDILQEISGIAFNKGNNAIVYAQQDEDGKLFKLPLGTKDDTKTKFAGKGDYEDVSIINNWAILLKSNGDLYSFPLSETTKEETDNVKKNMDLVPKGEYEGMFADEATGLVYLLCKNCKEDKDSKLTSGYILSFQQDGSLKAKGTFKVDASKIDQLTGKKKGDFHPSGLALNPLTKEWYIVSSVNKVLVVLNSKWQVKNAYHLSANVFNQPEGMAFDKDGNLYISNEGSETEVGNILRFDYKPVIKK